MGFDGILSSQRDAAEDDEDEDEVSEVGMVDEVVAGDPQTGDERERRKRFTSWDQRMSVSGPRRPTSSSSPE